MQRSSWRPVTVVARTTLRQTYRRVTDSTRMTAVFVALPVFFGLQLAGVGTTGAYQYGIRLAGGEVGVVADRIRRAALSGFVLLTLLGVLGAAAGNSEFKDRYVAFLTATTTGAVVVGNAARQTFIWTAMLWPAALAAALAFAIGSGSPVAAVSLAVGSFWIFVVTSVLTIPVGFAARWVLEGYDLSGNARVGLGVALMGVFYLVLFTREQVTAALRPTPLAWAGDLLLLTVPGGAASPARAGAFVLFTAGLIVVAIAAAVRLADAVWYDDRALGTPNAAVEAPADEPNAVRDALATVLPRPTATLVEVTWRRTKRTPKTLFYVYPGAVLGLIMAEQLVYHGPFSAALYPAIVAFTGAIAIGSGFTLNPLGTEGDALPAVLTSGPSSETIVRSKALAVVLPGVPIVAGGALGVGVALGAAPPLVVLASVAFALSLCVLAPTLSLALGVHYPPDSEGLLGGSVKVPNKSASAVYTAGMVAVSVPGFGALAEYAHSGTLNAPALVSGVTVTVCLALALSLVSYRHAVGKFDGYSVE